MPITIKVNGVDRTVDVDGDTSLFWVLRDVLGMTGTKFGCGMALCGACTVHLDGVAIRSCITPVDSIGTSGITTIEAIGATPAGAKIQKAWLDAEVVQCGYCQSGQIMSASALLATNPHPTDSDIDSAMSGKLWDLYPHTRSHQAGRAIDRRGRLTMIRDRIASGPADSHPSGSANGLSRRRFMRAGAAAGGGLMLGLSLPFANQRAEAADAEGFVPNAFIRVGGDGQIVLTMSYVEMGQGTYTSISMLIADELEVELKQVTGGACSAERKALLVAAAAKRWNVDPASCRAQGGEVLHPPTGRSAKYGELAANAARLPVPQNVPLKRQQDFKLIGTPAKRLDTPAKVNGTAVYGIDARPPGVKIATLAQSPVDQARRVFNNPHELRELRQTRDMGAR